MTRDNDGFNENEWTPEERARLGELSTERTPPSELKQRTVGALRERGLVRPPRTFSARAVVVLLAAASIVFAAAGAVAGFAVAQRRSPSNNNAASAPVKSREFARIDTAPVTPTAAPARHVVWF